MRGDVTREVARISNQHHVEREDSLVAAAEEEVAHSSLAWNTNQGRSDASGLLNASEDRLGVVHGLISRRPLFAPAVRAERWGYERYEVFHAPWDRDRSGEHDADKILWRLALAERISDHLARCTVAPMEPHAPFVIAR